MKALKFSMVMALASILLLTLMPTLADSRDRHGRGRGGGHYGGHHFSGYGGEHHHGRYHHGHIGGYHGPHYFEPGYYYDPYYSHYWGYYGWRGWPYYWNAPYYYQDPSAVPSLPDETTWERCWEFVPTGGTRTEERINPHTGQKEKVSVPNGYRKDIPCPERRRP